MCLSQFAQAISPIQLDPSELSDKPVDPIFESAKELQHMHSVSAAGCCSGDGYIHSPVFRLRSSSGVPKATRVSTFLGQMTESQAGLSAHGFIELLCHCRCWESLGGQWDVQQEGPESLSLIPTQHHVIGDKQGQRWPWGTGI